MDFFLRLKFCSFIAFYCLLCGSAIILTIGNHWLQKWNWVERSSVSLPRCPWQNQQVRLNGSRPWHLKNWWLCNTGTPRLGCVLTNAIRSMTFTTLDENPISCHMCKVLHLFYGQQKMYLHFLNRFKHLIQGGPPLQVTPSPHQEANLQSLLTNLTSSNLDKLQVTWDHHSDTKGIFQGCRMGLSLQQKQANKVKKTRSLCQLENRQRLMLGDSFHKDVFAILLYIFFREKSKII